MSLGHVFTEFMPQRSRGFLHLCSKCLKSVLGLGFYKCFQPVCFGFFSADLHSQKKAALENQDNPRSALLEDREALFKVPPTVVGAGEGWVGAREKSCLYFSCTVLSLLLLLFLIFSYAIVLKILIPASMVSCSELDEVM